MCQRNEKWLTFSLKPALRIREQPRHYSWKRRLLSQALHTRKFCSLFVC